MLKCSTFQLCPFIVNCVFYVQYCITGKVKEMRVNFGVPKHVWVNSSVH